MAEDYESKTIDVTYGKAGSGKAELRYYWRNRDYPWIVVLRNPRGHEIRSDTLQLKGTGQLGDAEWRAAADAVQWLAIESQAPVGGWAMGDRFEVPASARLAKADTGVFEVDHVHTGAGDRTRGTIYARKVTPAGRVTKADWRSFTTTKMKRIDAKRVGKAAKPGKGKQTRTLFAGCEDTFDGMRKFLKGLKVGDVIQVRLIEGNFGSAPYTRKGRTRKYDVTETSSSNGNAYVAISNPQLRSAARSIQLNHIETQTVPFKKVNELDATRRARVMRGYPRVTAHIGSKWYTITGLSRGKEVAAKSVPVKRHDYSEKYATIPRNSKLFRKVIMSAVEVRATIFDGMTDGTMNLDPVYRPSKAFLEGVYKEAMGQDRSSSKARMSVSDQQAKGHPQGFASYNLHWYGTRYSYLIAPSPAVLEAGGAMPKPRKPPKPKPAPKRKPAPRPKRVGKAVAGAIPLRQPTLNKMNDWEEYVSQLPGGKQESYDEVWGVVTETKRLSGAEYDNLVQSFLTDRTWLAGKGGSRDLGPSSAAGAYRGRVWGSLVIKVEAPGRRTFYIDPQGHKYARYVLFSGTATSRWRPGQPGPPDKTGKGIAPAANQRPAAKKRAAKKPAAKDYSLPKSPAWRAFEQQLAKAHLKHVGLFSDYLMSDMSEADILHAAGELRPPFPLDRSSWAEFGPMVRTLDSLGAYDYATAVTGKQIADEAKRLNLTPTPGPGVLRRSQTPGLTDMYGTKYALSSEGRRALSLMHPGVWPAPRGPSARVYPGTRPKATKKTSRTNGATYTIEAQIGGKWSQKKRTGSYKDPAAARLRVERYKTPWRIVEHRAGKRKIVAKSNGNGGKKHVERIGKLKAAKKAGRSGVFLERVLKEENARLSAALRGVT